MFSEYYRFISNMQYVINEVSIFTKLLSAIIQYEKSILNIIILYTTFANFAWLQHYCTPSHIPYLYKL